MFESQVHFVTSDSAFEQNFVETTDNGGTSFPALVTEVNIFGNFENFWKNSI